MKSRWNDFPFKPRNLRFFYYSLSITKSGSYNYASLGFAAVMIILPALSFKGDNPQDKFENEDSFS